jgi:hypothetical protein
MILGGVLTQKLPPIVSYAKGSFFSQLLAPKNEADGFRILFDTKMYAMRNN